MKKKIYRILFLIPLLLSVLVLTGCKVMMPSDYKKIKRIIIEDCNKVGLHGKVTITDLHWTPLESPTYYVSYTYSEDTYDDQTIKLEENNRAIHEDSSPDSYGSIKFLHYKESFLEQKSVQKVEKKIEKQLKKQKLGIPINFFSFLPNFSHDEKEKILEVENLIEDRSEYVKKTIGVYGVSEPCAYLASSRKGKFLVKKIKLEGMTLSIFEEDI